MVYTTALVIGHGGPPSSSEQDGGVFEMIGKYFFRFASNQRRSFDSRRGSVESCDEIEKNTAPLVPDMDPGLEDAERALQHRTVRQLERCLSEAKRSALRCQALLLPSQMTSRVSRDVVRSSAEEPCGLRGASITVYLEDDNKGGPLLKALGVIRPDPTVTPTFELSVVFKADNDGWSPLRHLFVSEEVLKLKPEYRLVKRKLYSSENPVIHHFH
ncbi:hypothetical protein NHX12_011325 [Muraenolepis orangiensis]|uniref:DNA damage-inducible transcript 4-like protein n=1 Tax=Muraenolepis orangiensis TaxID=630683 RepID=A0A9Q0I7I9_9TELE|nr:hypothetical protein NHX12_011325 [Muraenolepis orangiensis]